MTATPRPWVAWKTYCRKPAICLRGLIAGRMRALGIEVENFTNHCPHTIGQDGITQYLYGNIDLPGEMIDKILNQLGMRQVSLRWMRTKTEKEHRADVRRGRRRQKTHDKKQKLYRDIPDNATFIPYSGSSKITSNL